MTTPLIYPPTQDALQKTLDAQLLTGVTASATLNNVTGTQNLKGLMVIDRVDGNNNLTPNKREYVSFAGTSGSTVVTLTRGLAGSTDQDHAVGAIVEFVNDVVQQQAIIDGLLQVVTTAGALDTTKVTDLTTAQALTNKTITDSTNNVMAKSLKSATTTVDVSSATAPSTGQVLTATDSTHATWQSTSGNTDGWTTDSGTTWTYASATTINVADGTIFGKGDRIKLTQTTAKYFVVVSISGNVLTVTGGSDYTVVNASITTQQYSHQASPVGFPQKFNYTFTVTTGSGTITTNSSIAGKFSVVGNHCSANGSWTITTNGTGATDLRCTLPITADNSQYVSPWLDTNYIVLGGQLLSTTVTYARTVGGAYPGADGKTFYWSCEYYF
jgi:hypothetical protein